MKKPILLLMAAFALTLQVSHSDAAELPDYAADIGLVQSSYCRYPVVKTDEQIKAYFQKKERLTEKASFEYKSFKFPSEYPFYFRLFKNLIDPKNSGNPSSYLKKLGYVAKKCTTISCSLELLFPKENVLKILFLLDKYNLNVSHLRFVYSSPFRTEELESIFDTLEFIPPHLLPLDSNKQLTHGERNNKKINEDGVYADAQIMLYNKWSSQEPQLRKYLLFHEIAHNWASASAHEELDEADEWLKITGWIKVPSMFSMGWDHAHKKDYNPNVWVSKYASVNSYEDFAESISAYRFNPKALLAVSPQRYQFIKKRIFGGIEFLDNSKCHMINQEQTLIRAEKDSVQVLNKMTSFYNAEKADAEFIQVKDLVEKECLPSLASVFQSKPGSFSAFNSCASEIMIKLVPDAYDWIYLDRAAQSTRLKLAYAKRSIITAILYKYVLGKHTQDIMWVANSGYDCNAFGKNLKQRIFMTTQTPSVLLAAIPTIGKSICENSKLRAQKANGFKSNKIDKSSLNPFLTKVFSSLGI